MDDPVVIVGAGLSGLRTASLLGSRGVRCLVLEARDRPGGRAFSTSVEGRPELGTFDLGPTWFWPRHQSRMAGLVGELGLGTFTQHTDGVMLAERFRYEGARRYRPEDEAETASIRLSGGLATLTDAIAAGLPEGTVQRNARVLSLRLDGARGVEVEVERPGRAPEVIRAARVVLALPPRIVARRIRFDPALPPELVAGLLAKPTWMAGQAKVIAVFERPFWREAGLSGLVSSVVGPLQEIHDASPPADSGAASGALLGFFGMSARMRSGLGEERVLKLVVDQLARLFGPSARTPAALLYKDWASDPETAVEDDLEPMSTFPAYGAPADIGEWQGRILFAGAEAAPEHGGYLEGALLAAEAAASRIGDP